MSPRFGPRDETHSHGTEQLSTWIDKRMKHIQMGKNHSALTKTKGTNTFTWDRKTQFLDRQKDETHSNGTEQLSTLIDKRMRHIHLGQNNSAL